MSPVIVHALRHGGADNPVSGTLPRARRVALTGLVTLGLAAALSACAPGESSPNAGAVGAGYQAGDGSFATWDQSERGDPIELTGTTYDGEEVSFEDVRGNVVVVNFWYAACPPCRVEAPDLAALANDLEGEILMFGVNPRDDTATAQAFETTFEIPYPSINDRNARAVAAFEGVVPLSAMPTTVVLDRQGRVAARILGQADPVILRGLVDDVRAEA